MKKPEAILILILGAMISNVDSSWYSNENIEMSNRDTDAENGCGNSVCSKITNEMLEKEFEGCDQTLRERQDLETRLAESGRVVTPNVRKTDPSLIRMRISDPLVHTREWGHLPFDIVTENLYRKLNLSRDEIESLQGMSLDGQYGQAHRDSCSSLLDNVDCDPSCRYRTANGQCNNLRNPMWGSAMTCQQRLLPAYYEGNSGFRRSINRQPLPAPRQLSLNLHYHYNRPTNYVTHMYMFFGQLLDHDITLTPVSTTVNNQAIECCPPGSETHPQCQPILVPENDPFYSEFNTTCLNFVRSAICATCNMGYRQQMDQVTSFIDASFVYGNSENETLSLRENDGTGRLRTQRSNYGDLLPPSPNPNNDQCSFPDTNDICFQAGDSRANQHTVLTSLHTIFVREHNRIAGQLRRINWQWDEERLFQETRRIVGALMQVITYKEYLPITLGDDRMSYFNLWTGRSTRYDPSKNPTMMIEFTTAAFRFGHSLINSLVASSPLNSTNGQRLLRNEFFQPFDLYRGYTGPLVQGASYSPAQWFDTHLVPDVTNYLYRVRGDPTGLDLAATNINRGRDHGVPTYVDMARYCSRGQINIRRFRDLQYRNLMGYNQQESLRSNYRFVQDVDLWPGILMEMPNEGAVVGPTAACIIGMQFHNLKYGDRFYFEHANQAGSFTYRQLQELRKMTLSKILCLNTDATQLPTNAMLFPGNNNPNINCAYVREMDLSFWKE